MHPVLVIARNVVRESLRRRVLYLIVLFIIAFVALLEGSARFEGQIRIKMVKDFSYTIVSFFGLVVALISTFDQLPAEIDSKTIYLPLARPISRQTFVLGKYFGIVAVIALFLGLMALVLSIAIGMGADKGLLGFDAQLGQGLILLFLKYTTITSLLLFLSVVLSRPLAVVFSLFVYMFGHVNDFLDRLITTGGFSERVFDAMLQLLSIVLPKFSVLDPPGGMVYAASYSLQSMAILAAYSVAFAALYLTLAVWFFAPREL